MNIEIKEIAASGNYPLLMISKVGRVVLFTAESKGTLIFDPQDDFVVGHVSDCWADSEFRPFTGTISVKE